MEGREDTLQLGIGLFFFAALGMVVVLARIGTRRVLGPLEDLTRQIASVRPATLHARIQTRYADAELADIAGTINHFLEELDAYVQREKSLVSLASHELRTPVTVISGALDVLEQRGSLGEADRKTVARIRRAADEMHGDVQSLLKLARSSSKQEQAEEVDLAASVRAVIAGLGSENPALKARIEYTGPAAAQSPVIETDPALVRMLLRNLVHNALRHTTGQVCIELGLHSLRITDMGEGLPEHIRARLDDPHDRRIPEEGLGLFIVRLICERLGWLLQARRGDTGGTVFDLRLPPDKRLKV